jgi:preprotein translocase subunit SecB
MPHNTSPLALLNHRFISFDCIATEGEETGGDLALVTNHEIEVNVENPLSQRVTLTVSFEPEDSSKPSTYKGSIKITGEFLIHETFEEKNREALIRVTAVSMLYGACREMIANFTARSTHGILSLPSISFRKPKV